MKAVKSEVIVKAGGEVRSIKDRALSEEIREAYGVYMKLKSMESELAERKLRVLRRAKRHLGKGASFTAYGVRCSISKRKVWHIPEENVKKLRALLGGRFNRLVRVQRAFIPDEVLTQMAGAKKLVRVKELSPRFTWEEAGR